MDRRKLEANDEFVKVLRPPAATSNQLPQAKVRPQQPAPPKEEDQVNVSPRDDDYELRRWVSENGSTSWQAKDDVHIKCYCLRAGKVCANSYTLS